MERTGLEVWGNGFMRNGFGTLDGFGVSVQLCYECMGGSCMGTTLCLYCM